MLTGDLTITGTNTIMHYRGSFGVLGGIYNLVSIDTSSGKLRLKNTAAGYLLYFDRKLKSVKGIEDWDVSQARDFPYMFDNTAIPALDLSKWDVSNITNTVGMFYQSFALESVNLSGWDLSRLTDPFEAPYAIHNPGTQPATYMMFYNNPIKRIVLGPKTRLFRKLFTYDESNNGGWTHIDEQGNRTPVGNNNQFADFTHRPQGAAGTYLLTTTPLSVDTTVHLNANGGENGRDETVETTWADIKASNPGTITKPHNLFTSWNTLANGHGTIYQPGDTIPNTVNTTTAITLYAQWKTIPTPAIGSATLNTSDNTVTVIGTAKPYASGDRVEVCTKPTSQTADYNTATQCLTFTINDTSANYDGATDHSWSVTFPTSLFPSNANYTFQAKLITADSWHSNADADSERTAAFTQDLFPIRQSALPLTGPTNHHDLAVGLTAGAIVMLGLAVTNFKRRQFLRG